MHSQSVVSSFRCLLLVRDSRFRTNVVGVMVGLPQPLKKQRRCTPALMLRGFTECRTQLRRLAWALTRFRPARHQEASTHASGSRGTLAPVKFTSGVQCPNHRSAGAPRARWARPELGKDPDVTPDQHCEEWRGLLWDRAFRRSTSWRFNHFSYSSPTAHFPSPA